MLYRIDKKTGNKLSALGLGCMRFPKKLGGIDIKKAEVIIKTAIEKGINYFDTAWMYPGSEEALGLVLEKNQLRDKVYIASKLPVFLVDKAKDIDHFFNEELKRLRTNSIDYYLMHNLTGLDPWNDMVNLGIKEWITAKKESGQIGRIGFSFHGALGDFEKLLEAYPWEFCQIQYNYSDVNFQAGIRGLKKAAETMPVIIMEPLLGGKLANGLPPAALKLFRAYAPERTPAAWGLRWLWNQSEAAVVLSGMSDPAQVTENAALAEGCSAGSLAAEELEIYDKVREVFNASYKVHCTGCAYCMPCPHGVNIPGCFAAYNTSYVMGWAAGLQQFLSSTGLASNTSGPERCVSCGTCEEHCPQKIPIIAHLKQVRKRMEPFFVRILIAVVRKFIGSLKADSRAPAQ
ncbi:aldo/keto reductase [Spirochaetia bacterium]|nr:aldo/keto reductase [Spirochaetia bacterium]